MRSKNRWLAPLSIAACLVLAGATSIHVDDPMVSTVPTGTAPIFVSSTTTVKNFNADLVDGVHASDLALSGHSHTLPLFKTFGPAAFAAAAPDGDQFSCSFPALHCTPPDSAVTDIYLPLGLPAPSVLTEVDCFVFDDDSDAGKDITMEVFNGDLLSVGSDMTAGSGGQAHLVVTTSAGIVTTSRGPTVHVKFDKGSAGTLRIFECVASFTMTVQ